MLEVEEAKKTVEPWAIIAEMGPSPQRAGKPAAPLVRLTALAALVAGHIQELLRDLQWSQCAKPWLFSRSN